MLGTTPTRLTRAQLRILRTYTARAASLEFVALATAAERCAGPNLQPADRARAIFLAWSRYCSARRHPSAYLRGES